MRNASLLVFVLLAVVSSSCRKKTYAAYYQLDGQQSVLVARDGDAAYESPEMEQIIAGLNAVPDDAREKEQAIALVTKLNAERARVKAARDAIVNTTTTGTSPAPTPSPAFPPGETQLPPPTNNDAPAADADAGVVYPEKPVGGMSEADFVAAFGKCFGKGADSTTQDGQKATAQVLKSDSACVAKFAPGTTNAEVVYLFVKDRLWGSRSTETRDAGSTTTRDPPTPPPPLVIDAGTVTGIYIPGTPTEPVEPPK